MTLPRSQRLKGTHPTLEKVRHKPLEVKLVGLEENQACMIIPKRYVAKACDRNRMRRTCLEIVRKSFKERKIGSIVIRVYTYPEDLEAVPKVLSQCINQLRC